MKKHIRILIERLFERFNHIILNREIMSLGIDLKRDIALNTALSSIKTVFDVGANIGDSSLFYREIFKSTKVFSFEPISSTFEIMQKKVKHDNNIITHKIGFSDVKGKFKVFLQSNNGLNSLNDKINVPQENMNTEEETITVSTIDEFCLENNISSIDFLKTDTEGVDLKVLKGAEQLIKNGKIKYILVEVGFNEDNIRNTPFEEVRKYLLTYGYKLRGFHDQSDFWNKQGMETANALFKLQH